MSRGPRRLLDDPDFQWETGCDLADEQSLVGGYDLASMKEAVVAKVGAAAAAGAAAVVGDGVPAVHVASSAGAWSTWLKPLVFGSVGVATVGTAFWLGVVSGPELVSSPSATEVQAVEAIDMPLATQRFDPVVAPEATRSEPWWLASEEPVGADEGGNPASEGGVPGVASSVLVGERVELGTVDRATPEAPPVGGAAPSEEVEPSSDTPAAEGTQASPGEQWMAAMDACELVRIARSRADCYRSVLHEHGGVADPMVELAWIEALRDAGDAEGTAALANRMRQNPAHEFRYGDLRMMEAESLAKLGRCDHALSLARDLPRDQSETIRKACRRKR